MNPRSDAAALHTPRLRLVGRDEPGRTPTRTAAQRPLAPAERLARREVARENHAAAAMPSQDVRLAFAAEAAAAIEGGRAAILRPERRRDLMTRAHALGLRAFDANLVIAIVQEASRRGEPGENAALPDRKPQRAHANLQVLSQLLPARPKTTSRDEAIRFAMIAVGVGMCILAGLIAAIGK